MRIQTAAAAAMVIALTGCGAGQTEALEGVWDSLDQVAQKAFCEAAIQNGTNFYGPAQALAAKAGDGIDEHEAQQFLLDTCPDAWLMGGQP